MINNKKVEVWIGLLGLPYAMRAEKYTEKAGKVTFIRHVEGKYGRKRTEQITTDKKFVVYVSETVE